MDKNKLFILFQIILMAIVVGLLIIIVVLFKGDVKQCLGDPKTYFEEKTNTQCYCMKKLSGVFEGVGLYIAPDQQDIRRTNYNLTNLTLM